MTLATRYLGLQLTHPIVASASPLTATFDGMRQLEDAGAAAVVMSSLYEEQIRAEDTAYAQYTDHGSFSQAETGSYFPELPDYDNGHHGAHILRGFFHPRWALGLGLILIFGGIGTTIALHAALDPELHTRWSMGLIPAFVGVGFVLHYLVTRKNDG